MPDRPIVAIVGASSLPGVDRISTADIERAVAAINAAPVSEDPMVVWIDEAADLEPWQFEALNDTLFGRSPTEPPAFGGFPYKQAPPSIYDTVIGAPTPKRRPPKKQQPRKGQAQRKARQTMRRNRK